MSCMACVVRPNPYLSQATSGLLLADIALGHVLLEHREQSAEEAHMVAEQTGLCNAPGVQAAKQHLATSIAAVQLTHCKHVAHLQKRQDRTKLRMKERQ